MKVWRGIASVASVTPLLVIGLHSGPAGRGGQGNLARQSISRPTARIHLRQQPNNHSKVLAYIPGDARGLPGGPVRR